MPKSGQTDTSSDPFFSVVIPVYDRTRYVRESIYSALSQDFDDYEIIVVLDGSPDATRIVVEDIRDRNRDRVRVISYTSSSGTACRARNTGILYSRAEFISLLDSDDLAAPDRLRLTKEVIDRTQCDVAYGAVKFLPDEGRIIPKAE